MLACSLLHCLKLARIAREPFFGLDRISGFWSLQKAVLRHFWPLAQNHCQNGSFSLRASHFSVWTEYLVWKPPEGRFNAFLAPSPKNHIKHVVSEAWALGHYVNLQKDVSRHFWPLAQNHYQNGSFSLRASHFSVWTEYLVSGASRKLF